MANLPDKITLQIVTPERQLGDEHVDEVRVPGRDGQFGILPGHAPLLTELGTGMLSYTIGNVVSYLAIINGYAEVLPDRVIVLAETGERAEEIDVERAEKAKRRAEEHLAKKGSDVDWDQLTAALQRALVRLQVASKGGAVAAHGEHS